MLESARELANVKRTDRDLTQACALQLGTQSTDQKQEQHTNIADQRPERMTERGRPITLNGEVADPGERIAYNRRDEHEQPLS